MKSAIRLAALACAGCCLFAGPGLSHADGTRTRSGLVALYDFGSASGPVIKDRSGVDPPLDLRIADPGAVRRTAGSLEVRRKTLIHSGKAAGKIIDAVRRSGEITIEAWIHPAQRGLSGPARIVTLSNNPNERNFTLGQDTDRYDARLRTTRTSTNGMPSLSSPRRSLATKLTHVVYTRDRQGQARLYVNGKPNAERKVAGAASNWDRSFRLALANELSGDRPWLGTYYLVAVYRRGLPPREVEQNFKAGAGGETPIALAGNNPSAAARLFETQIAPLLARHCLECHGFKSKKGGLDLSRKTAALAGGESGQAILPGQAAQSLLWQSVASGEMPKDRRPLSTREKRLLRRWIDEGAVWSIDEIRPSAFALGRRDGANWLRRLTVNEYIETVRGAAGVDVEKEARRMLPRDLRADGFSNTAYNLNVDLGHVEAYARLAGIIAERMDVGKLAAEFTGSQDLRDANLRRLIAGMGQWLLRGPLEEREIADFLRVAKAVAKEGGDFKEAARYVAEAMLQSPRFLYRIEDQRGDGKPRPVAGFELASRLSYIIWGGPPDKELMRAAAAGELADRRRAASQVRRMLEHPRAVNKSAQFIHEWLDLDRLDYLRPNPQRFPQWNAALAADMREETLAFFHEVAWKQRRPLWELLNAQVTFATPRLAKHYGLRPMDAGRLKNGLSRYDLSSVPSRGGLLTQGGVLTVGGDEASMVTRGLFVLHDLLRGAVKDPPPCVDTTPVPTKPGLSQRSIAMQRIANQACGACHSKFEPLAFGLEKYDGLGAFFEKDKHGNKLRDDGEILFPGREKPVSYRSSAELMDLLAGSERVRQTLTWKVTQWALGRPLGEADRPRVEQIHKSAREAGGTYASLITAIVMSDLVRMTRTETRPKPK